MLLHRDAAEDRTSGRRGQEAAMKTGAVPGERDRDGGVPRCVGRDGGRRVAGAGRRIRRPGFSEAAASTTRKFRAERRHGRVPERTWPATAAARSSSASSRSARRTAMPAASGRKSGRRPSFACPTTRASGTASPSSSPIRSRSDDHRYLIAQWKREIDAGRRGRFQPVPGAAAAQRQAVRHRRDQLSRAAHGERSVRQGGCAGGGTPVWLRPETNQMRALVATDARLDARGRRALSTPAPTPSRSSTTATSCRLRIPAGSISPSTRKPGPDGTGHIEIFANGKPIVTVKGHIGHADKGLGKNQYFKFGPYRAGAHDRMDALLRRFPPLAQLRRRAEGRRPARCPLKVVAMASGGSSQQQTGPRHVIACCASVCQSGEIRVAARHPNAGMLKA